MQFLKFCKYTYFFYCLLRVPKEERVCEIASINHTLITHEYQIEALRNKVTDVETLNNSLLDNLGNKNNITLRWLYWSSGILHEFSLVETNAFLISYYGAYSR